MKKLISKRKRIEYKKPKKSQTITKNEFESDGKVKWNSNKWIGWYLSYIESHTRIDPTDLSVSDNRKRLLLIRSYVQELSTRLSSDEKSWHYKNTKERDREIKRADKKFHRQMMKERI